MIVHMIVLQGGIQLTLPQKSMLFNMKVISTLNFPILNVLMICF